MLNSKKSISIIGGGSSALSIASFLDEEIFDVTIYESNKALGRKFLVAGKGGFNLTHSESVNSMISKYSPLGFLDHAILSFDNTDFRAWLDSIGVPTFTGSSRRVFPEKEIKPIEVLNSIIKIIKSKGHKLRCNSKWLGWSKSNSLVFENGKEVKSDIVIFCLGGGSWKVTGSDGTWNKLFRKKEIKVNPFVAANCAYNIEWNPDFVNKTAGKPLKNISISCSNKCIVGEVMITDFGLEGSAIYALTDEIHNQLLENGSAELFLDLKPMLSKEDIKKKLLSSNRKTTDALLKDLKLEKVKIQLLKSILNKQDFIDVVSLSSFVKRLPLHVLKQAKIDEAISTFGGIDLDEIDDNYQFNNMPSNYVIGEMLDWNAPTGGYLLQACFSMGHKLAMHLNEKY